MAGMDYDAIVVGSGPNGLAAAIKLQLEGLSVLLLEGKNEIGGGTRTAELTLPGFQHDICAAVHPMALLSPFFSALPLEKYGLKWIYPAISAAHPFDDGSAAAVLSTLEETANQFANDRWKYIRFVKPILDHLTDLMPELLKPFPSFKTPKALAQFGLRGLQPASWVAEKFHSPKLRGLWAGMAAHSMQPLNNWMTSAIGLMLLSTAHAKGWPIALGGSQNIAKALVEYFLNLGGKVKTGFWVRSLKDLPTAKAIFFDTTPRQLLDITGDKLPKLYRKRLRSYRYGMGVFKIDWALNEPIPFKSPLCRQAGTVHIGGTFEEIAAAEKAIYKGKPIKNLFVLLAQPSVIDPSRAPENKHVAWAYCHAPHGSAEDFTQAVENQICRFAPGFNEIILARHSFTAQDMENYNPNYVGGDINGGVQDLFQHFSRPILSISPYRTPSKGIYICSSSTPPGGGVHGMCGYNAALQALKDDIF